ncbi:hypothetical protein CDO52_00885 [Nocardiopsis gilva YIM 90087]|uniref:Uncharacterized protein n=2 Tax=Nocardiopsis gilva TaxID=280236 RepID=A0A223S095_9ACTN|nr:hypothetical protein CDO52_00885 [Nocardiopsis gilva YIM 90087]
MEARDEAVALIARRISERDGLLGADRPDAEPFAASLLAELSGLGWRPTAARATGDVWRPTAGHDRATPAQVHAYADRIRGLITPSADQENGDADG